ncbi:hypothetical protein HHK36_012460 [Tetracentron sinense]|uniref:CW-type domain-containing protein n=1 Tax=Tetracentron sinense TaxID=13715 RepID=A0A834Z8R8_TETSI|nr:hypothetical protein HHK36_012460 [Tetracentron sinense]
MLSVGSRDGRKGLGLGFAGEGEMEETELEEGEACYYQEDDASIDPDVALSYIDEKLQDVLGHFQKDFEGGVSAENLGAKFGGYGSFLPTYQRSPSIWAHPRTPQKAQNYSTPRSPNNCPPDVFTFKFVTNFLINGTLLRKEKSMSDLRSSNLVYHCGYVIIQGARQNSTVSSSAPLFARLGPASSSTMPLPVSRAPSVDRLVKRDTCWSSAQGAAELTPKREPVNKLVNPTDQKTLKVRIKVGTDNTSARKNAEIYSGLGLDISPSSSLEDSPMESGGMSPESRETLDESPTSIIQVIFLLLLLLLLSVCGGPKVMRFVSWSYDVVEQLMTSFPIPGGLLLSPIPDSLLRLSEKEKLLKDGRSGSVHKGRLESYAMLVDESPSVRRDGKVFGEKKIKSVEKNGRSVELKNGSGRNAGDEISDILKNEIDIETPAGKDYGANTLKLQLLSNSKCTVGETAKVTGRASDIYREANKGVVKEEFFSSDIVKEEALETISSQEVSRVEKHNAKTSLAEKVWEDQKASYHKDVSVDSSKGWRSKGDKTYYPSKVDSNVSKGRKDPPKQKVGQKATSYEMDVMKLLQGREQPSSGSKKKSKGSQSNGNPAAELPMESLRVGSYAKPKNKKKSTHAGDHPSKSIADDVKLHKELEKASESYRYLFGDIKLEQAENRMDSLEPSSKDRPKDSMLEVGKKDTHTFADKSKETSSGKKIDNLLTSEAYLKTVPDVAHPLTGNGRVSDVAPAVAAPLVIEENWVCCDKCQKWRLLPHGRNPDHLPKKWLCSMLNWLPGMNRCNISEEETTKALNALYQIPAPESQNNMHSDPDRTALGGTVVDVRHFDYNPQDFSSHAVPSGGKKKYGSKGISIATSHSGLTQFSDFEKKNQHASVKAKSLNDANEFLLESNPANEPGFQHLSKSSNLAVEKHKHKQKEKQKLLERYPDGGDAKHSKGKSKREAVADGFRASKKIKTGVYYTDEHWNTDHDGAIGRVGPTLSSGLPAKSTGKDLQKHNEYSSSKDSKCNKKDSVSIKKPKDQVQVSMGGGLLDMGKCDKRDISVKKRKAKEWQDSQIELKTLSSTEHHLQDNRISVKETSESERRKEKKARVSKSVWKESSTSKGDGKADKKGRVARIILSGNRDQPVDGMEEEGRSIEKGQQLVQYRGSTVPQQTSDGIDSFKRDFRFGQPSIAATSSSSKVSGSRKTKANFHELKGSPVESVSSSPLRIFNPEKLTSAKRNLLGNDDAINAGLSVMDSPRRCSDGEGDGGIDRSGTVRKEKVFSAIHQGSLESSVLDCQDRDANHISVGKAKQQTGLSSSEFDSSHLVNGGTDTLDQHQYSNELLTKNHCHDEERVNNNHYHSNGYLPRKSEKSSSSRSKDKHRTSKSDYKRGLFKASDSFTEQEELYPTKSLWYETEIESHDRAPYHEEMRDRRYSVRETCGVKSEKDENNYVGNKDSAGKWSSESSRIENQSKIGQHEGSDVKLVAICSKDVKSTPQQNLLQDHEGRRSSNLLLSDRSDRTEIASERVKSQFVPLSGDKQETLTRYPQPVPRSHKGGGLDVLPVDNSGGGDLSNAPKQRRKTDNKSGAHHNSLRHHTPNGHGIRDFDSQSPVRKDAPSLAAANALKEATNLKHSADRLKNSGSDVEVTGLYFEAALKFLHGASLLEPFNSENAKHGEMTQSVQVYSSTAKLCEYFLTSSFAIAPFNSGKRVFLLLLEHFNGREQLYTSQAIDIHIFHVGNESILMNLFHKVKRVVSANNKFRLLILKLCAKDINIARIVSVLEAVVLTVHVPSGQSYLSVTVLLKIFCAHGYERRKEMAAAALAYKCMEVAYMRVIYSKNSSASIDRHELQTTLQMVPPGESPSSSASDLDNLNNQATLDKASLAKGISSPQIVGNHVIVGRNRPNFVRLLDFAQYVNFAMEASRKSHIAFTAANLSLEEERYGEVISSVKRVLDFNFQDVEGLLRQASWRGEKPPEPLCYVEETDYFQASSSVPSVHVLGLRKWIQLLLQVSDVIHKCHFAAPLELELGKIERLENPFRNQFEEAEYRYI